MSDESATGSDDHRTLEAMAPLTRTQLEDRARECDNDLVMIQKEYGDVASAWTDAKRDREEQMANAYGDAEGNSTDRRQAALRAAGKVGLAEEKAYVRIVADWEVRHDRSILLASLLKSAGKGDEDPRYRS